MQTTFIIGNGPSAISKPLGEQIDAADNIIRINDFKIDGFEQYVGRRTTVLFTCRLNEYLDSLHTFPSVVLCLLMNPLDGISIPESLLRSDNIVDRIDWDSVERLSRELGLQNGCYATTGFLAVLYALQHFGHVNIIGFDGLGGGNRHYYENGNRAIPIRHDGAREVEWLRKFAGLGLLTNHSEFPQYYSFDGHDPLIKSIS